MKNRKKKLLLVLLIIIVLLLAIKSCSTNNQYFEGKFNFNKISLVDENMVDLKKLIEEDELCDDEWAKKFLVLGKRIEKDSNFNYLKVYYQENKIDEDFIKQ